MAQPLLPNSAIRPSRPLAFATASWFEISPQVQDAAARPLELAVPTAIVVPVAAIGAIT
jgi:hypothetical protein